MKMYFLEQKDLQNITSDCRSLPSTDSPHGTPSASCPGWFADQGFFRFMAINRRQYLRIASEGGQVVGVARRLIDLLVKLATEPYK